MIIWFWTWKTWFAVCSLNITWMRSVGRFLSGVRSPEEVFKRSKAIVAISEVQRLIEGRVSSRYKMFQNHTKKCVMGLIQHSSQLYSHSIKIPGACLSPFFSGTPEAIMWVSFTLSTFEKSPQKHKAWKRVLRKAQSANQHGNRPVLRSSRAA